MTTLSQLTLAGTTALISMYVLADACQATGATAPPTPCCYHCGNGVGALFGEPASGQGPSIFTMCPDPASSPCKYWGMGWHYGPIFDQFTGTPIWGKVVSGPECVAYGSP